MGVYKKSSGFESEKLIVLPDYVLEEFAQRDLVRELYITDIGYFPRAQHHYRERPGGCDSNILLYCAEGSGWVQLQDEKPVKLKPHSVFIIPAGIPHRYEAAAHNPWSIYWFHFKGTQASEFIRAFELGTACLEVPMGSLVKFTDLFDQCYHILSQHTHSQLHHIQLSQAFRYLLSNIICVKASCSGKEGRRDRYLEQSIQYMSEHLHTTLSLTDLAKYTGVSKPHLIHLFKQSVGYPPIDYFLRMKIQRASQMLDLTYLSIMEISASIGINDPYYFSRIFKKVMGYSPTAYRQIQKG